MPRSIDLNLIPALRALLEERSVSKAADRMHMSQPSLSAALARLRQHYDDPLLVRSGNRYEYKLTPLGISLLARVYSAQLSVDRLFEAQDFDPLSCTSEFTIFTSDFSMAVLGGSLATVMRRSAPGVTLRFENITLEIVADAPDSLRDYAGAMLPHGYGSRDDNSFLDLFTDRWVCVVSKDNELVGEVLSVDDLSRLPWVSSFSNPAQMTPPERQMRLLGVQPHVEIGVPSFLAIPAMVSGTDRIAFLLHSYARGVEGTSGLRILECPFGVVPFLESFWWSPTHNQDPEHQWLRAQLPQAVLEAGLTPAVGLDL
jgi:DNA-binding transcriptional LysR family regulator